MPVHLPGEGEVLPFGPSTIVIKANRDDTDGKFFLSESTIHPGTPTPPPHTHQTLHDMFYVLEGTLTLRYGDDELQAPPGTFACVPPGTVHTFYNRTDAPVRFLNFNAPGGFEQYMRELSTMAAAGPPDPTKIGEIASKYDVQVAS